MPSTTLSDSMQEKYTKTDFCQYKLAIIMYSSIVDTGEVDNISLMFYLFLEIIFICITVMRCNCFETET